MNRRSWRPAPIAGWPRTRGSSWCRERAGSSDGLERLERLAAGAAVVERAALGGPEEVVHRHVGRGAPRTAGLRRIVDRGGEAGPAQPLAPGGGDPVRRPRDAEAELDLQRAAEHAEADLDGGPDGVERRAPDERRQQLDADPVVAHLDVLDHPEVHDRHDRDLRVRDVGEGGPDRGLVDGGDHQVAPGSIRRTDVKSAWSARKSSEWSRRPRSGCAAGGSGGRPWPARTGSSRDRHSASRSAMPRATTFASTSRSSPASGANTVAASEASSVSADSRRL